MRCTICLFACATPEVEPCIEQGFLAPLQTTVCAYPHHIKVDSYPVWFMSSEQAATNVWKYFIQNS